VLLHGLIVTGDIFSILPGREISLGVPLGENLPRRSAGRLGGGPGDSPNPALFRIIHTNSTAKRAIITNPDSNMQPPPQLFM
jgi:hypothetical protein